ncbi:MAG: nucleotidyl transferase AbiEii/AbiGii toxin family protein, partial [Vicinamibacterales bacterium]
MTTLSQSQQEDLRALLRICGTFNAEVVLIGATAYRLWMDDAERHTLDIDLALALDLDAFAELEAELIREGWQHSERH